MNHDYVIFIQARLGSTRFPKKIIQKIGDKRVLDHVIDACTNTGYKTILLTPECDKEFFLNNFNIEVFGGSELDVLSRFYECAKKFEAKNIVRITSDCPCVSTEHINAVIETHRNNSDCFVSNVSYEEGSYRSLTKIPDGFDVEIFSFKLLEKTFDCATSNPDREHVTSWMRKNCKIHLANLALALTGKFSLDQPEDLKKLELYFSLLRASVTVKLQQ